MEVIRALGFPSFSQETPGVELKVNEQIKMQKGDYVDFEFHNYTLIANEFYRIFWLISDKN